MKRLTLLLLLSCSVGLAEEVKLTQSALLKGERTMISLKKDTVVEVLSRDDKLLLATVRFGKVTGTIPLGSLTGQPSAEPETSKKQPSATPTPTPAPPATGKATTTYGKAVEKAKDNAGKHEKNLVHPTDEILN